MTLLRAEGVHGSRPALLPVLLAATACRLVGLAATSEPSHRVGLVLLLAWQLAAATILHRTRGATGEPVPVRPIPVRFNGDLGKYSLWSRGDGRMVEIRDGEAVIAELEATDDGDRLVVDPEAARGHEVESLGTALGRAIEMVAAADAYRAAVGRIAAASTRTRASVRDRARLLRRIGSAAAGDSAVRHP
jgi:hypothetical protein